jgi:hypothetical protein
VIRRLLPYALTALLASALTWWWVSRASEEALRDLRAESAEFAQRLEIRDSLELTLRDSLTTLADSVGRIAAKSDTVRIEIVRSRARGDTAAANLRIYLSGDDVGLALFDKLDAAHKAEITNLEYAITLAQQETCLERQRTEMLDRIIAAQDSTITELRGLHGEAMAQAEAWYRKAHPPLVVRLFKDGWKFAAGVGLGYLLGG